MTEPDALTRMDRRLIECRACPRLVAWREHIAEVKRAAFKDETYWGRPIPGLGPHDARIAIVGLAPAAHGANRTGRMFTGDRSGDFLFASMYRTGLANGPKSVSRDDDFRVLHTRVTAPVRCAPPDNKPLPSERDNCRHWLAEELDFLAPTLRSIVVLGGFGWQALLPVLDAAGWQIPRPRPKFRHGARVELQPKPEAPHLMPITVFGSFHVSQQNTFTGRLTPDMLDEVLRAAAEHAGVGSATGGGH